MEVLGPRYSFNHTTSHHEHFPALSTGEHPLLDVASFLATHTRSCRRYTRAPSCARGTTIGHDTAARHGTTRHGTARARHGTARYGTAVDHCEHRTRVMRAKNFRRRLVWGRAREGECVTQRADNANQFVRDVSSSSRSPPPFSPDGLNSRKLPHTVRRQHQPLPYTHTRAPL